MGASDPAIKKDAAVKVRPSPPMVQKQLLRQAPSEVLRQKCAYLMASASWHIWPQMYSAVKIVLMGGEGNIQTA